ncbi:hypothetical protein AX17_006729 [Amanita inopinata Kibby_2008]|nr:hypothetical protein AX17_006729 [Amanita inopinata Kibby_2008]
MDMSSSAPSKSNVTQPQAAMQMTVTGAPPTNQSQQTECEHKRATRLRGGGAGKDCFIGLIGCFLCFECCEGCCECIGDIVCCPCEMCC